MGEHETPDFVTEVQDDGSVRVPAAYLRRVGFHAGSRVSVRLTELVISEEIRARGVGEAEVDRIGAVQLESRENVLAFLASEGRLSRNGQFARRFRAGRRSGR